MRSCPDKPSGRMTGRCAGTPRLAAKISSPIPAPGRGHRHARRTGQPRSAAYPGRTTSLSSAVPLGFGEEGAGQGPLGDRLDVVPRPPERGGDVVQLAAGRDAAHQPVVGVERHGEAQPVQPVDRVGGQRGVGAGLHVGRRRDLQRSPARRAPAAPPGPSVPSSAHLVGDPDAVPEPLGVRAVQRGADALDAVGLAGVDRAVRAGPDEHADGRRDAVGREADLRPGQVEADDARRPGSG